MEPNDYLEFIKQAYKEQIKANEDKLQVLINSKNETIESLNNNIDTLKQENNFLKQRILTLESIIRDLDIIIKDRENKLIQVYNQYNIQSPGGTMSNPSGDNINNELNNVRMGGGFAGKDYTGDVINNYSFSELQETVNKINQLIEQYSQTNPTNNTSDRMKIAMMVVEEIEQCPTWKQQVIKAGQQGLLEAMKSNPIGAFVAGAIKGWKEQ